MVRDIYQVLASYPAVKSGAFRVTRARRLPYNSDIDLAVYVEGEAPPELYLIWMRQPVSTSWITSI